MNKKLTRALETIMRTDVYKIGHKTLYPWGLKKVFSNFTPRSGNWAEPDLGFVVATGMERVMLELNEEWNDNFFSLTTEEAIIVTNKYASVAKRILGLKKFKSIHFMELHELGYLPLEYRAVAEGTHVEYKTPILTLHNTDDRFGWLVNYLETVISAELWPIVTASTRAYGVYQQLLDFANLTGVDKSIVDYQAHDFSYRGMEGSHGARQVGIGHLTHFKGSDNLPAILATGKGESVIATEHSVMSAGTKDGELETYRRLIKENQKGILSIVSDTWNIYNVCDVILPKLKEQILSRDGLFVIRPDSGDAIEVLLGVSKQRPLIKALTHPNVTDRDIELHHKGLFQIIEEHFGYTINEAGFKELPIGFLWGDGMTPGNIDKVFRAMLKEGYASSCLSIGVGSYMYQLNTRDTYGFAMKATYVEIANITEGGSVEITSHNITKDPITDSGVKKSAKGLLAIIDGKLVEETTWDIVNSEANELKLIPLPRLKK